MKQLGLSLVAGVLLLGASTTGALAHAQYSDSSPRDGEGLAASPSSVTIWYTEGIQPAESWIHVRDSSGSRVDLDDSMVVGDDSSGLMVDLQPDLPPGDYTVSWQNTAEDGDGLDGSFHFSVGEAFAPPPAAMPAGPVPTLSIAPPVVTGHQVQVHVDVQGATLTGGAMPMDSSMGGMAGMPMSGDGSMPGMAMDGTPAPGAHLHVYVDGTMAVMETQPDFTLSDVPSGTHEIRIELADNMHQAWNPPVDATAPVVVP